MDSSCTADEGMQGGVELIVFSRDAGAMPQAAAQADIIRLQNVLVGDGEEEGWLVGRRRCSATAGAWRLRASLCTPLQCVCPMIAQMQHTVLAGAFGRCLGAAALTISSLHHPPLASTGPVLGRPCAASWPAQPPQALLLSHVWRRPGRTGRALPHGRGPRGGVARTPWGFAPSGLGRATLGMAGA